MEETMKSLKPVLIAYIVLSIIVFLMYVVIFPVGPALLGNFSLLLIWVYATGILIIIQSISLIRTKKVGQIICGILLLAIALALILFGHRVVNMILWFFHRLLCYLIMEET
jgi:hypothetical protein